MTTTALEPAFDQRHPGHLNRFPPLCLQTLAAMSDPTGKPRFR